MELPEITIEGPFDTYSTGPTVFPGARANHIEGGEVDGRQQTHEKVLLDSQREFNSEYGQHQSVHEYLASTMPGS